MVESSEDNPACTAIVMTCGAEDTKSIADNSAKLANSLIGRFNDQQSLNPEDDLREALKLLLAVFWIRRKERVSIAKLMHEIGKFMHNNDWCYLKFRDGHYYTDCPNMLLHKDFGFSLRGTEKYICSVCGADPIDCDHRTGQKYSEIECFIANGFCNICRESVGNCKHVIGIKYDNVEAVRVVSKLDLVTFDFVKEPEMPLARITEIPYGKNFIINVLSGDSNFDNFEHGKTVIDCAHCVDCKGYDRKDNEDIFK